jgi:hypothetical protein
MRWEARLTAQLFLCATGLLLSLPLMLSLAGGAQAGSWAGLADRVRDSHPFREVTGYLGLALIIAQSLLSVRKRTTLSVKGSYAGWRGFHILTGVGLVFVIAVHTGGRWGANLNGWLLFAFIIATFAALVGKLLEAALVEWLKRRPPQLGQPAWGRTAAVAGVIGAVFLVAAQGRLQPLASAAGGIIGAVAVVLPYWKLARGSRRARGSPLTRLRGVWLAVHVLSVCILAVLLGFHILSVYYF